MLKSLKCVVQCLEQSVSPDKNVLAEARLLLEKCAQENMGQFISNMSIVIADQNISPVARQAAVLQVKTCLTVRDGTLKENYHEGWTNLEEETRIAVRERLISTLGTENIHPSCAAQCLAYIMAAGLFPQTKAWFGLFPLGNFLSKVSEMVRKPGNEHFKEAALESISFMCQEISVQEWVKFNWLILDIILFCMADTDRTRTRTRSKCKSERIRQAAARGLLSSLECIRPSFDTEEDRKAIMKVVFDATQSSVVEESVISFQILVKISSLYYHHIKIYMESDIVPLTLKAISSTESDIALQGMEFWRTVSEKEYNNLASGDSIFADVVPSSRYENNVLHKILSSYLTPLIKGLVANLEDDDHRLATAACKTLSSLARIIYQLTSKEKEGRPRLVTKSWPSRNYEKTVKKLLQCCGKFQEHQKCAAQEALVNVLCSSPDDCKLIVQSTIQTLMEKLRDGDTAKAAENDFPFAKLFRAINRYGTYELLMTYRYLIPGMLLLIQSEDPRGVLRVKKDVFEATSIFLLKYSYESKEHMPALITYFNLAVESRDPCHMEVSVIGELFRALGTDSLPYLDGCCLKFFDILARNEIPTKLRSNGLATLTKMAYSVGEQNFLPYIARTLNQLEHASSITVKNDPEHEELQRKMIGLYDCLFYLTYEVSGLSSENRNQELNSQRLSLMEKCLAGFSELMVAIVDEDTSNHIIIESGELVGIIFMKLGTDKAMKYLKSNLNLKWLLTSAVHRAREEELIQEIDCGCCLPEWAEVALRMLLRNEVREPAEGSATL